PTPPAAPAPARRRRGDPAGLLASAKAGDRGAIGRLLSLVERGGGPAREVGRLTFAAGSEPDHVVGVTGAPGAGKSTLTDGLLAAARAQGRRVAVLAVDPSSPFSGGAILGDRIRMQRHALDEDVFIRSMASRGHTGGLALAAPEAVRVLVAAGFPLVLVETVGDGQVEVEIAGASDTTVVVVTPGWGDAVQTSKAGLLEVADVLVVNKADRAGADQARRDLDAMLDLGPATGDWRPPVLLTVATAGDGAAEVWEAIVAHRAHLERSGELRRRRERRLLDELSRVLSWRIEREVRSMEGGATFDRVRDDVLARRLDPYDAAAALLGSAPAPLRPGAATPRRRSPSPPERPGPGATASP
ncbi:MAG: methylmalonyl Co-A mutase-associated GTPase MeaB, partial [Acidimicrobiales bacterium]